MPNAVFVIWWVGLAVTLLVFVPLAVHLLHRTWNAARAIQRYAAEAREAVDGIARNTAHVPELDTTITVAASMLPVAGEVASKLATAATVLAQRAE
jgi:hypothetical protein